MMFEAQHREEEVECLVAELAQQRADAEAAAEDALSSIDSETEASTYAAEQVSPERSDQTHYDGRQPGRLQAHPQTEGSGIQIRGLSGLQIRGAAQRGEEQQNPYQQSPYSNPNQWREPAPPRNDRSYGGHDNGSYGRGRHDDHGGRGTGGRGYYSRDDSPGYKGSR